jgi:hypothetical protein
VGFRGEELAAHRAAGQLRPALGACSSQDFKANVAGARRSSFRFTPPAGADVIEQ